MLFGEAMAYGPSVCKVFKETFSHPPNIHKPRMILKIEFEVLQLVFTNRSFPSVVDIFSNTTLNISFTMRLSIVLLTLGHIASVVSVPIARGKSSMRLIVWNLY